MMFGSPGVGNMLGGSRHEGIREGALFCPGESGGACHWRVRGQEYKKSGCATSSPALRVLAAVAFTSRKKNTELFSD